MAVIASSSSFSSTPIPTPTVAPSTTPAIPRRGMIVVTGILTLCPEIVAVTSLSAFSAFGRRLVPLRFALARSKAARIPRLGSVVSHPLLCFGDVSRLGLCGADREENDQCADGLLKEKKGIKKAN